MERKDYAQKFHDIKNDILLEIRSLVPEDTAHHFSEKFYVHYVEGEVATTEICTAVEVWHGGMVVFIVHRDTTAKDEVIEGESVFMYDPDSFLDILDHLKKDLREKKLATLRTLVKDNGNSIDFDGTFDFIIINGGEEYVCQLSGLRMTDSGKLQIEDICDGERFANLEEEIADKSIEQVINYVKSKVQTTFEVHVAERRSRIIEVTASSWDEAKEKAKEILKEKPFNEEDSDGFEYY